MSAVDIEVGALQVTKTQAVNGTTRGRRLDYLPVGLFGSVMGLTGLSVAWRLAQRHYGIPGWAADVVGVVAITAFVALTIGYLVKLVTAPDAVMTEFRHPIAGNLFGTILISLLLLPIVLVRYSLGLAQVMWVLGAVGMFVFAWMIVTRWMSDRQQVAHATPAWIVPVVGLLDVPLALPSLGLPPIHGVMITSLAIGLFFAIPLFTLIFSRLVFEPQIPDALLANTADPSGALRRGHVRLRRDGGHCRYARGSALRNHAVHPDRPAQSHALSANMLPLPGGVVGRQLPVGSERDRLAAFRYRAALVDCRCDRVDPSRPRDARHRRPLRTNALRHRSRRTSHPKYLKPADLHHHDCRE